MKALVIGGNGFIGSHLVDELAGRGWEVTILDPRERRYDPLPPSVCFIRGDLTQPYLVRKALRGAEVVFHLAWTTIHEVSNQDPAADVHTNLIPSIHLMEACHQAGIYRLVFTSSGGTVYGPAQQLPIQESHRQEPINGYGITKLAVEKYLGMFQHLYGLDYVVLRPSVPYGPRQSPFGRQGAVAVFLYRIACGLPVTIWGDGSVTRDYFYITDLVRALIAAAQQPLNEQRVFNLGGRVEISLLQLLDQVEATVGRRAIVDFQPGRKFDARRLILDTRAACHHLNWQPEVALPEGLAQTWAWMAEVIGEPLAVNSKRSLVTLHSPLSARG